MPVTEEEVMSALKSCYDPEIPVNIVDLGLIYKVNFAPVEEDKQDVAIDMTLTAQGCPEHVNISMQVKSRLEQLARHPQRRCECGVDSAVDSGTAKP